MGHNRGGDKRRARLKRARREHDRLASKAEAQVAVGDPASPPSGQPAVKPTLGGGIFRKVKEVAREAVEKVGGVIETASKKIRGTAE